MANQVTEQVSMWVNNDYGVYSMALELAQAGDTDGLRETCLEVIGEAPENSAAHWLRDNFAPRELREEVDWSEVASDLASE